MDAVLARCGQLLRVTRYPTQTQNLQKGVAVLRSELDGEVEVVLGYLDVEVLGPKRRQVKSRTFAPYLARLRDLVERLDEGSVGSFDVGLAPGLGMIQLDVCRPESAGREVDFKALLDHLFCFVEEAVPDLHHDRLEEELPLAADHRLGAAHYLAGSRHVALHFEELGIVEERHGDLLRGDLLAAALDESTGSPDVTEAVLDARADHPDLPPEVVRAIEDAVG